MAVRFKKVAILGRHEDPRVAEPITGLAEYLAQSGVEVLAAEDMSLAIDAKRLPESELADTADLIIAIGGDGAMLFAGQLHYSGGRMAQVGSSFDVPFHTHAEILGAEGVLTLRRPFLGMDDGQYLYFTPAGGEPQQVPVPQKELYLGEVEDMHAAILDGEPNYLTLEESRDHVRTTVALYESAARNQVVRLDG